jgi:hypothetical protein
VADQSDVEQALVNLITTILYPTPPTQLSVSPVINATCRIFRGWPVKSSLDADLAAGVANISVISRPGTARPATRYVGTPVTTVSTPSPTLTVAVAGNVVTWGGTGGALQITGVQVGTGPNASTGYAMRLLASDTPTTVAARFAAGIPGASISGSAVTIPTNLPVKALVEADVITSTEERRQDEEFQITISVATPALRDVIGSVLDLAFAQTPWLTVAEALGTQSSNRMTFKSHSLSDRPENADLFVRMIFMSVNYAKTLVVGTPLAMFIDHNYHINGPSTNFVVGPVVIAV